MACLSEPFNRPLQEFAHGGRFNADDPRNFAIAESGSAKMQALALLLGKPCDLTVQTGQPLALEKRLFGIRAGIHECFVEFRSPLSEPAFFHAKIERQIVGYAIEPRPLVFDAFAFVERNEETEKGFLPEPTPVRARSKAYNDRCPGATRQRPG